MKLNDARVKAARLENGKKQMRLSDGSALYLHITKSGKYWRMNYRFADKQKTIALGVYPQTSLKEARLKSADAKKLLEHNIDPMKSKKDIKKQLLIDSQMTNFKHIAEEWLKKKSGQWKNTTFKHKSAELHNHVFPWVGDMKADEIKPYDILSVCQKLESRGYNEQAHRVMMACSQVLRFGVATGRVKYDITRDLKGALTPVSTTHRPCLKEPKQVGALLRVIDGHRGTLIVHSALKLSPLIFLRPVELRTLEWREICFEAKTITIPAPKMKMKETHIVPLSNQAIDILKDIQHLTGRYNYVFPGARTNLRPMSDGAINAALRRLGYDTEKEHCAHGFRGTASTLLHELGYNTDVIERQLAHKEGNAIKAAYNHARHMPERTKMMQEWADYLDNVKGK